ncbi:hypothetical protein SDJN02_03280 [Cucurbita argyrosperma subsp. argyrosperma]|nr:hypothetical protein SDJN02_03280 [Cucurbita argyrosperma subsp. argyrosperma]
MRYGLIPVLVPVGLRHLLLEFDYNGLCMQPVAGLNPLRCKCPLPSPNPTKVKHLLLTKAKQAALRARIRFLAGFKERKAGAPAPNLGLNSWMSDGCHMVKHFQ